MTENRTVFRDGWYGDKEQRRGMYIAVSIRTAVNVQEREVTGGDKMRRVNGEREQTDKKGTQVFLWMGLDWIGFEMSGSNICYVYVCMYDPTRQWAVGVE